VLSFNVTDVHAHDLATILDSTGVCIRSGHHCAQPLMRRLCVSATARASFYVYNDERDIDALVAGVSEASSLFAGSVA
jgi:cysteine desulfurase/selenocysteine lyase